MLSREQQGDINVCQLVCGSEKTACALDCSNPYLEDSVTHDLIEIVLISGEKTL